MELSCTFFLYFVFTIVVPAPFASSDDQIAHGNVSSGGGPHLEYDISHPLDKAMEISLDIHTETERDDKVARIFDETNPDTVVLPSTNTASEIGFGNDAIVNKDKVQPETNDNTFSCSEESKSKRSMFADPHTSNCFYFCDNGAFTKFQCPFGAVFVQEKEVCEFEISEKAGGPINHDQREVAVLLESSEECPRDAHRRGYLFADPMDSSSFYQCSHGKFYLFKCPMGLVFSNRKQYCDWKPKKTPRT